MNNEIVQPELDMPQLRQMVLDNTKRIDRNELMINIMRKKIAEQTRKNSELNESLEISRKEHDRRMKNIDERLDRIAQLTEASKIKQEEHENELKETWRLVRENSAQMKERDEAFDKRMKESDEAFDKRMKETDKQMKEMFAETNASIRRVSVEFLGVTGHMVEGLVSSSVEKIFKEAGFDLHDSGKNLKRELPPDNKQMEVDAMLSNESVVVPVEVKEHFTKKKVKRFLHKMEMFRKFFPECDNKEVFAAVAAINYEAGAAELAHEEGLLVIRVSSEDIFSLDPVDKNKLRKF